MNLIILGAPGSGKGTQAKLLADHFGLTHISSGQLLRQAAKTDPALQQILDSGELVPFGIVLKVILPSLKNASGFVLDGTPRNLTQAIQLDQFFKEQGIAINHAILLDLPDDEAVTRLLKRAKTENRPDDNEDTIRERLKIYNQTTIPVIDYYFKRNLLRRIDGRPDIETIFQDILRHLA